MTAEADMVKPPANAATEFPRGTAPSSRFSDHVDCRRHFLHGTWMQAVGAGWMIIMLTLAPLMVGCEAASSVPVFLVILPAGALADLVDRRRFV